MKDLIDILLRAFDHMVPEECSNVVIAFGNTGCGKSTLLGSMIMGPNNLEKLRIMVDKYKQNVIDYKQGGVGPFPIGHKTTASETFYPTFHKS